MDKYEEAAEKLFAYLMDDDKVYSERAIAAALRESAAEAFEEASKEAVGVCSTLRRMYSYRAAAIRSTTAPPRAAGERNK